MNRLLTDLHLAITTAGIAIMGALSWWPDSALMLWNMMPYDVKTQMPSGLVSRLGLIIFVISAVARIFGKKT
jgi:hypothetical protein